MDRKTSSPCQLCDRAVMTRTAVMFLEFDSISAAHQRIRAHINRTPVLTSPRLDAASGAALLFKRENFQQIGAFKARGATNDVFALDASMARCGGATHYAGI